MRNLTASVFFVVAFVIAASAAHADIVVPEQVACRDKQVGDACDGGTCQSTGFSCQAGSCRRHGDEAACRQQGCNWVEGLSCRAAPPTETKSEAKPTETKAADWKPAETKPTAETKPAPSCGQAAVSTPVFAVLLLLVRRRRAAR